MVDGQVSSSSADPSSARPMVVGTTKEAHTVRPPFTLVGDGVSLEDGVVSVCVNANVDGVVELFAPALDEGVQRDGVWPKISMEGGMQPAYRQIAQGNQRCARFDGIREKLKQADRQFCSMEQHGELCRKWPVVVIVRPRGLDINPQTVPDGSLILCCTVDTSKLKVARQLIAWGGNGTAYVIQDLYGIQEAQSTGSLGTEDSHNDDSDMSNQKNCVICLTTQKDTALLPCGHFCVCNECGIQIRLSPGRNRCPLCRAQVNDIMRIVNITSDMPAEGEGEAKELSSTPDAEKPVDSTNLATDQRISSEAAEPIESTSPATDQDTCTAAPAAPSIEEVRAARLRALEQKQKKEPEAVAENSSNISGAAGSELPTKCLQRLTREIRQIEHLRAKNLEEHGVELSQSDQGGNDLQTWNLRILTSHIDPTCALGTQLRAKSIEAIEFEVWIPAGFPGTPPVVRVLRPTFELGSFYVFGSGALCMELLTSQGWPPALSLPQMGVQLKVLMAQGNGQVLGPGNMESAGPAGRKRALEHARRIEESHADWRVLDFKRT